MQFSVWFGVDEATKASDYSLWMPRHLVSLLKLNINILPYERIRLCVRLLPKGNSTIRLYCGKSYYQFIYTLLFSSQFLLQTAVHHLKEQPPMWPYMCKILTTTRLNLYTHRTTPQFMHTSRKLNLSPPSRYNKNRVNINSSIRTSLTFQAVDIDDGENGKIIFTIADVRPQKLSENIPNPTEFFLINQFSGELRLNLSSANISQRVGEYQLEIEVSKVWSPNNNDRLLCLKLVRRLTHYINLSVKRSLH